jgi:hypothetical protein
VAGRRQDEILPGFHQNSQLLTRHKQGRGDVWSSPAHCRRCSGVLLEHGAYGRPRGSIFHRDMRQPVISIFLSRPRKGCSARPYCRLPRGHTDSRRRTMRTRCCVVTRESLTTLKSQPTLNRPRSARCVSLSWRLRESQD